MLGFLVSLFELPCTGGVYLAILGMLAKKETYVSALMYLALYNFIFVLPLAVILLLFWKGVSADKMEKWRKKERKWMKLVIGIALVFIGVWMLI